MGHKLREGIVRPDVPFFQKQNPATDRIAANRSVTVILSGCRRELIDSLRKKEDSEERKHTFLVIDDFRTLLHQLKMIKATEPLPILLIGPHINHAALADVEAQIDAIETIKDEFAGLTIIAIQEELQDHQGELRISRSIIPPPNCDDENPTSTLVLGSEGDPLEDFDYHVDDLIRIREAGADSIIYVDELLNGAVLGKTVEALASDTVQRGQIKPIICEVRNGSLRELSREQIESAKGTMDKFSIPYNSHMILTGHFDAMFEAYRLMLLNTDSNILGNKIVDLGCGTSYPMAMLIGKIMIPQFKAMHEINRRISSGENLPIQTLSKMTRSATAILSVDRSIEMLRQTKDQFEKLKRRERLLKGELANGYISADISELDSDTLRKRGFDDLDTIIVSMLIHWQPKDEKENFVRHIISLMPKGSRYIAVEEWPQSINPSPYIDYELMKSIERDLRPIPMDDYYSILTSNGLTGVEESKTIVPIDRNHSYHIKVFTKD